ncbi:MAG: M56 family metallopeptidase [Planctomycetota bacterium]
MSANVVLGLLEAALCVALAATVASAAGLGVARVLRGRSTPLRSAVLLASMLLVAVSVAAPLLVAPAASLAVPGARQAAGDSVTWAPALALPPTPVGAAPQASAPAESSEPRPAPGQASVASRAELSAHRGAPGLGLVLLGAWAVGALVALAFAVARHRRAARWALALGRASSGDLRELACEAAGELDLAHAPPVHISAAAPVPLSIGVRRPRIVLPPWVVEQLERDELKAVLLHELAHVKNRDGWVQLIQSVTGALHWWNPMVRRLNQRLSAAREELCDNHALTALPARGFAEVLVAVAERALPGRARLAGASLGGSELHGRVARLLRLRGGGATSVGLAGRAFVAAFVALLAPVLLHAGVALEPGAPQESAQPWPGAPAELATLEVTATWSDGSPAAGVTVETHEYASPNVGLSVRRTPTDQRGIARVEGLWPGYVHVKVGQRVIFVDHMDARTVYRAPIRFEGARVEGRVVDTQGMPVEGARVSLWTNLANEEGGDVTQSGADGRFVLIDVPQDARFAARASGFEPSEPVRVRTSEVSDEPVHVVVRANSATLRGTVVDAAGKPVAGAHVFVGPERIEALGKTPGELVVCDTDGRFVVDSLRTGSISVQARGRAYQPTELDAIVNDGEVVDVRLELAPDGEVAGRVVDPGGRPVFRGSVSWGPTWRFASASTMSGPDGSYVLRGLPTGSASLKASSQKSLQAETTLALEADAVTRWSPVLAEGRTLDGQLIDDGGAPLQRWYVYAYGSEPGGKPWYTGVHTDEEGRFRLRNAPGADVQITLNITAPGGKAASHVERAFGSRGDGVLVIPARLLPSAFLKGSVRKADGSAATEESLQLFFQGGVAPSWIQLDPASGTFRVGPLPPRTYELRLLSGVRIVGELGSFRAVAGTTTHVGDFVVD